MQPTLASLRVIRSLTEIVLAIYAPVQYLRLAPEVRKFFDAVFSLQRTRGWSFTIKYVKDSRLAVMRCITGRPLKDLSGVKLTDGWPTWLLALRPDLSNTGDLGPLVTHIRILLTLLTSLRIFHLPAVLDVTPIITPYKGGDPAITDAEHRRVCAFLGIRPTVVTWDRFHSSVKSGPMGPALESAVYELPSVTEYLPYITKVGGTKLARILTHLLTKVRVDGKESLLSDYLPKTTKPPCTRKLAYFSDKEGKTRVVGILDYWSQSAVKPLHDALAKVLKAIPTDCTFNQGAVTRGLTFLGPYYSYDLSNATDRMPITLQKKVIATIIGNDGAAAWAHLLSGYEFATKGAPSVKYQCGQPMGAYSS